MLPTQRACCRAQGEASMRARASAEARFSLRCARRPFPPPPPLLPGVSQVTCQTQSQHWYRVKGAEVHLIEPLGSRGTGTGSHSLCCGQAGCRQPVKQWQTSWETDMPGGRHDWECGHSLSVPRHVWERLLTCFLPGLLWAGVAGSSTLGDGAEPTDLLLPVCTIGAGLAACLEAEATGDVFPLPCKAACKVRCWSSPNSSALEASSWHTHRGTSPEIMLLYGWDMRA